MSALPSPPDVFALPGIAEPVSSISHLGAAAVFACLALALIERARKEPPRAFYLAFFAVAAISLLAVSGTYHLLSPGPARSVLRRLDHAGIFVLIAATFTAGHGLIFRGIWRWGPIAVIWTLAAAGIALKMRLFSALSGGAGVALYLALGWLGAISAAKVWRSRGWRFIRPVVWGGAAYSTAALVEIAGRPVVIPGVLHPHEVAHFAVLAGIAFHWRFLFSIDAPAARAVGLRGRSPRA